MISDLSKYKRFFAFGCSFTSYNTPTWADILASEMPNCEYYNFGQGGSGNLTISNRIAQANRKYKFNENDLVIVMFTSVCREDRYIDDNWHLHGNVFNQDYYDKNFVKNYCDPIGYLVRDLALIELVTVYLKNLACDSVFLSMANLSLSSGVVAETVSINRQHITFQKLDEIYKDIKFPSVVDDDRTEFRGIKLYDHEGKLLYDGHPMPDEYLKFLLDNNFPITELGKQYVNDSLEKIKDVRTMQELNDIFPEIDKHRVYRIENII